VVLIILGIVVMSSVPLFVASWMLRKHRWIRRKYLHHMVRIFQEKPLLIVPRGLPIPSAQDVRFPTTDGLTLAGCYLKAPRPRRGVILFGVEFGSNRWSCWPYVEFLLEAGFDIFAYEPRNQVDSDSLPGYEPLQWLSDYEVQDAQAALRYLKSRPDADPHGVGFFGISKGGNAGLYASCLDPYVRCCVSDGAFGTYTTMVPYLRKWLRLYNQNWGIQDLMPSWYCGNIGMYGVREIERVRGCHFPHLESVLPRLAPRPLLMIHGGGDTYIRPEMARGLYSYARSPREFWLVEKVKHNQAVHEAAAEYRQRVLGFFERHLAAVVAQAPVEQPAAAAPRSQEESRPLVSAL
jgi:dipeptidyl aminopeptidase/acylaminoacyl peptidase